MKKQSQSGSSHVIVVSVLVVALLGALGFIFWQNFISKKDDTQQSKQPTTSTTKEQPKITTKRSSVGMSFGQTISFSYPSDWKLSTESNGESGSVMNDLATVSSPDGKTHVVYNVSNAGIGGTCQPEDIGTLKYLSYENTEGVANTSFVDYIYSRTDGPAFGSVIGLAQTSSEYYKPLSDIKVGDSYCDVYLRDFLRIKSDDASWRAMIYFGSLTSGGEANEAGANDGDNFEKLKAKRESADYETAKNILLSTKY